MSIVFFFEDLLFIEPGSYFVQVRFHPLYVSVTFL